ncbi:MAG: carbohydrate kinase [Gammaproteobacteria bacterium]|nr:carbohydrate kinase [Gammaproteobacteria bacterium]
MSDSRLVIFGEVLFDCFPDDSRVLGGAPFNVAWHTQAFGLNPLLISRIGDDAMGAEIQSAMLNWGMDTDGLQVDTVHPTGVVTVNFDQGNPAYNIIENSAWDFINSRQLLEIDDYSMLYHGSLALRKAVSANCLAEVKNRCSESVFVDVNLRPPWWNLSLINAVIKGANWLKINDEELLQLVPDEKDSESRARFLLSQYALNLIIVTKGSAGAVVISENDLLSVQPEKTINVIDTVGAGDAFSSVLLLGLHNDWSLNDTIKRAQQFASAVVGLHGATTLDKNFYTPFIENWSL